jgi:hypothetical protein
LSNIFRGEDCHLIFRRKKGIALGVLLVLMLIIPVSVDSQDEGLSWGFDAGQKLYFKQTETSITNNTTTFSISFNFYMITQDNYTIPDPLTYFPFARGEPFFYNDTPVMEGYISFAVPIGNWDLLEAYFLSHYSSYYDTITIIDDETTWGFQTILNTTGGVETQKSIFSKTDGVLISNLYEFDISFLSITLRSVIERIAPPLMIDNLILVIGGVVIVLVLLGTYFFTKRRGS